MKRLRIPAGLFAAAAILAGCTPATGPGSTSPTPLFSAGVTPLVGFSPPPANPNLPPCEYPAEVEMPDWVPGDLPMLEGTYAHEHLPDSYGYKRGIFVVQATLDTFTRFVLAEWPAAGWTLGRGDSEPGEVEDQFTKPPAVGAFKAQSIPCNPGYSLMILIYAPDSSTVGANPNTQSGSPIPTSSPSS